ncbi:MULTISPECIES: hypothetical protein [Bacillaceae]|uniref:hypothetical protein n=1 Tax=Bacillaceae TaxID=186817 RepID=UPI0004E1481C|nr:MULTISPECIES: hypothetical protein [Bacillaceae]MCF2648461.1 hypothetical protein [Niallia circulans]MCM3361054.1 hypothetical protein [Niallia sp. MER TA 168]
MVSTLIFISFFLSAILSILTFTKTKNKWVALLVAFCWNSVFLVGSTLIYYLCNEEAKLFGLGHTSIYVLPLFIPIISWIDFFIIELIRKYNKNVDSN